MKYFLFCFLLLASCFCFSQKAKIDSLLNVLKTAGEDTNKVNLLNSLGRALIFTGKYKEGKEYENRAIELGKKINYKKGIAQAYNNIGVACWYEANHVEALKNQNAGLKIRIEINDRVGQAASYNNLGLIYKELGNYPLALNNFFSSLKIQEETNNKKGIALVYNNLGTIYQNMENYDEALKNHLASLKIKLEINDNFGIAASYSNLGNVFRRQKKYAEALKNQNSALEIMKSLEDKNGQSVCYTNMATVYHEQGNFAEALKYNSMALEIQKQIGAKEGIATSYINLGSVLIELKKPSEAKQYVNKGLSLAKEIKNTHLVRDGFKMLSQLDSLLGNFQAAYEHYKLSIIYRDSLVSVESTKKTVQAQMQYDFDKQQTADSIKNVEQAKQEELKHSQEILQQKTYTYGGLIGFLLMIVVAAVSFRAFKQKQKANEIISEQKLMVEEKQKEILDSIYYAKRIQQSLLPTDKYIERSLARLKNKD